MKGGEKCPHSKGVLYHCSYFRPRKIQIFQQADKRQRELQFLFFFWNVSGQSPRSSQLPPSLGGPRRATQPTSACGRRLTSKDAPFIPTLVIKKYFEMEVTKIVQDQIKLTKHISSSSSSSPFHSSPSCLSDENEELQRLEHAPPFWRNTKMKKRLSKQLSMCEVPRDMAWERRRRQYLCQERRKNGINHEADDLTDEDLNELKGCIELGFGFKEEEGQRLRTTIPALDLYFAVNRQLAISPVPSPHSVISEPMTCGSSTLSSSTPPSMGARSSSFGSPRSDSDWKICSPGDDPQQIKTKLRHWAQVVACSVMQSW